MMKKSFTAINRISIGVPIPSLKQYILSFVPSSQSKAIHSGRSRRNTCQIKENMVAVFHPSCIDDHANNTRTFTGTPNPIPVSTFPPRSFSTHTRSRRRRRAGNMNSPSSNLASDRSSDEDRSSANKPVATIQDREIFLQHARAFLDRAEIALAPMKAQNDVFNVVRSFTGDDTSESTVEGVEDRGGDNLTILLKPGEGKYVFQIDEEMCTLSLNSPMSGSYTYVLCAYTDQFVGMEDGHICEGMLVRDLIRHCNGLPQF